MVLNHDESIIVTDNSHRTAVTSAQQRDWALRQTRQHGLIFPPA